MVLGKERGYILNRCFTIPRKNIPGIINKWRPVALSIIGTEQLDENLFVELCIFIYCQNLIPMQNIIFADITKETNDIFVYIQDKQY